jgi:type IV pilus assembly protein PilP
MLESIVYLVFLLWTKRVYQLRIGAHLGQDFGKVIGIGDKTVDIEELIPEGGGRWTQRRTQLVLQEKK